MPEITVKHNVKDATPPEREVLPSGSYHALIIKVTPGLTGFEPKLQTISIEYQIVKTADGSIVNDEKDDKYHGRSVYQDYILEPGTKAFSNQREAFRIQQLMAATRCPYKTLDGGQITFNTDHLISKGVKITVTQRAGKKRPGDDPKAPIPIFNNVDRVDSEQEVAAEDMV
jgi:hypothetical protein